MSYCSDPCNPCLSENVSVMLFEQVHIQPNSFLISSRNPIPDIKTIVKFAQMEFKFGEAERGRTIFEGVMSNYPKRVDLWSIYLDMEIRAGEQDIIR